ncbi:STAS domain-containing protein [Actinoplanes sp. NPDC049118]|uniref:STAS domain-containing protein n=1 Tax=Actinoplanes sp. NPDC049118 TaxID=3155769 RepID=UPI0033F509C4
MRYFRMRSFAAGRCPHITRGHSCPRGSADRPLPAAGSALRIKRVRRGPILVVEVAGDVDAETAPTLFAALAAAIDVTPRVCCDLRGVDFFGADGANVLATAHIQAAHARGAFSVRGVHGFAARVLDLTGLSGILRMED